ncbi:MAG TPA: LptF/LptG family permease [bacterium]|nr:LptF/LptG family permease [bacterium]
MALPILDRYLWRHLRDFFLFGVAIFTLLLLINHLFLLARLVLQQGAPFTAALELLVYRLPYFLAFSFPMAMLTASLMAIARLSDGQEITAMRTSGISLARIAASVCTAGLLVSVLTFVFNEVLVPGAEDRYRQAFHRALNAPAAPVQEQVLFRDQQEGIESVYYARRFLVESGVMEGVVVNQFEGGRLVRVIEAPRAAYLAQEWVFQEGTMYLFTGPTTVATRFERLTLALRRTPREIALPRREPSEMSIRELRAFIRLLRRSGESAARYVVEVQSKLAVPASAALFALLAVPLGLRPHRSAPSVGLGLTIVVLIGYYIMISITLTLGQNGRLHPIVAAWLPDAVLLAVAIALLRRADR